MFCPNCGKDNPEGSKFCCACGTNFLDLLKKEEPVIPEQPVVQQPVIPEQPVVEAQPVVNVIETPVEPVVNNTIAQQPVVNNTIEDKPVVTNNKSSNNPNKNSNVGCFIVLALVIIAAIIFFVVKGKNASSKGIINGSEMVSIVRDDNGRPKFIDGTFTDVKVKNESDAYKALNALKSELQFKNAKKEFDIVSVNSSEDITYYKFQQKYNGVEVYGMNLVIAVDKDGNVLSMSGYYIPNINVSTEGDKTIDDAKTAVLSTLDDSAKVIDSKKYIYTEDESARLVYIIFTADPEGNSTYLVDANTNEIIDEVDTLDGAAYEYRGMIIDEFFDVTSLKVRYRLHDPERNIYIIDGSSFSPETTTPLWLLAGLEQIEADAITGDLDNSFDFVYLGGIGKGPEIAELGLEALRDFEEIYDFYYNVLGRDSYNDKGAKIIAHVGVKEKTFGSSKNKYQNASWDPSTRQIYIGAYGDIPLTKAKDVLAHEFTHAVISETAGFAHFAKKADRNKPFEAGALNEGIADIMGCLIEGKNWQMGEAIGTIRDLEMPSRFKDPSSKEGVYYFPDWYLSETKTLEDFIKEHSRKRNGKYLSDVDNGGVHYNATIPGHAAYLMYNNGAFTSMEEEAKVWYNALLMMSSYSTFEDCALAVIQAAKNLGLSQNSINIIEDAFMETNMLGEKRIDVSFEITADGKGVDNAKIELKGINGNNYNYSYDFRSSGISDKIMSGAYELTVTSDGCETFKKTYTIYGETRFLIDLKLIKTEEPDNKDNKTDDSKLSCKSGNCHKLTMYYLDSVGGSSVNKRSDTFMVDDGTVLGTDTILGAANSAFGSNFIKSDGESFYVTFNGMTFDFAWYYKGTDKKFNFNTPITEDVEIEMKMFDGLIDEDFLTDIYTTFGS